MEAGISSHVWSRSAPAPDAAAPRAACADPHRDGCAARRQSARSPPTTLRGIGQCAFVGMTGRCSERGFLEFHHVAPFAAGGSATTENIELRCRAHNIHAAELFFGSLLAREESAIFRTSSVRAGPSRAVRNAFSKRIGNTRHSAFDRCEIVAHHPAVVWVNNAPFAFQ
jgi:hypothetical protein